MLIPWSGGIDSSVVLYDALNWWHGGKNLEWISYEYVQNYEFSKRDCAPRAIVIESNQFDQKQQEMQLKARTKLESVFKKKKWNFENKLFKINTENSYCITGSFPQPMIWLSISALLINDNEPLVMGWIRGDDATARLHSLRELWKMLTEINGKRSSLVCPLRQLKKHEVVARAKKLGILNRCWYCESPKDNGRICEQCESCLTMTGAKAILDQKEKNMKHIKEDVTCISS